MVTQVVVKTVSQHDKHTSQSSLTSHLSYTYIFLTLWTSVFFANRSLDLPLVYVCIQRCVILFWDTSNHHNLLLVLHGHVWMCVLKSYNAKFCTVESLLGDKGSCPSFYIVQTLYHDSYNMQKIQLCNRKSKCYISWNQCYFLTCKLSRC